MRLSHLADVQRAFARVVRHDAGARTAIAEAALPFAVVPGGTLDAAGALDVHNGGYLTRARNVLRADYPGLAHALGEDAFLALARRYVAAHPSDHPNLFRFGRRLPEFVARQRDLTDREALRDLARLEHAMVEAFHAPDAAPLDPARLGAIAEDDWADVRLVLHPSVRLLATQWPASAWLDRLLGGGPARAPDGRSAERIVLHRDRGRVRRTQVAPDAFRCLSAFAGGRPLGEALALVGDADVGDWLRGWTASRIVVDLG